MAKTLLKKYIIKRKLRSVGGYMDGYLARQAGLDRDVELRIMSRPASHDGRSFKKFKREFKALGRLDHPNICRVLDVGYTKTRIYYTTEHRNAISLDELLQRVGGPLTRVEIVEIARSIGDALAHIHKAGILHRNISTHTVYYDLDNARPYMADFSVIRDLETQSLPAATATARLGIISTPEMLQDIPHDQQTDLYLFGRMLYRLAVGLEPRLADDDFELEPVRALNNTIPAHLDSLIMRLVASDRKKRFRTASDFLRALENYSPLMDAESLIMRQRGAILGEVRKTMRINRPGAGKSKTQSVPERRSIKEELDALSDDFKSLFSNPLFIAASFVVLGCILLVVFFGSADSRRAGLPRLAVDAPAPVVRVSRDELEDKIIKTAAVLAYQRISPDDFKSRWSLLKKYCKTVAKDEREKTVKYSTLLSIKLHYYEDEKRACRELEDAYKRCSKHLVEK